MTDDEVWNAEGHKEVLIACSAVSSAATSCTNPFADGYVVSSAATRCTNPFADDYVVSSSDSDGASSSSANEFGNLCLSSAPTTTTVSPVNLRSAGELEDTYGLHEKNVTVVLEASRAVHIQEWVLQYDNRLTVSESDPSVYFIDIPNVLMVQLNFSTNDVECITSSEEWRTTFLKAFNAKWSRS
eukprot:gene17843-21247_t